MGKNRARIISKTAFEKAFVEGEIIMRRNLASLIQAEIERWTDEAPISEVITTEDLMYVEGLLKAKSIVFGDSIEG
jgi:hypothetical protein